MKVISSNGSAGNWEVRETSYLALMMIIFEEIRDLTTKEALLPFAAGKGQPPGRSQGSPSQQPLCDFVYYEL